MAKKKDIMHKAANGTVKLSWGGKLWTIDSNLRHYPAEFVSVYGAWLVTDQPTDQVTDQDTGQVSGQVSGQVNDIENNDIEVNNG